MIDKKIRSAAYSFNDRALTPLRISHAEKLRRWRNKQLAVLRQKTAITPAQQRKWFHEMLWDRQQVLFALNELNGRRHKLIGYCGIVHIDRYKGAGEFSFLVEPKRAERHEVYRDDFRAALWLLSKYAFDKLKLKRALSETYSFRKKHITVLEEFGFERKKVMRNKYMYKSRLYDSYLHEFSADKWRKSMRRCVVFDLDGTLTDEADWYLSKWRKTSVYVGRKYGFKNFYENIKRVLKKRGFFFKKAVNETLSVYYGVSSTGIVKDIVRYYKDVPVRIKVIKGAKPVLRHLRDSGRIVGLITNGRSGIQQNKFAKSGLSTYIKRRVFAEKCPKPSKAPYRHMAKLCNTNYCDMAYVGDNPITDFSGAKSLGIFTIRVKNGIFKDVSAGRKNDADMAIDNIADIINQGKGVSER